MTDDGMTRDGMTDDGMTRDGMTDDGTDTASAGSGDARVDSVLERLDELADLPVEDHPAVYDAIHARLREVLSGLDDAADGSA